VHQEGMQHRIRARIEALTGLERTQAFYDAWLSNHTTKADIDSLKAWGFNSVRLPMHYNLYTLPVENEPVPGRHTWLEKGFALTDSLLAWCKANQLYLILDLHAAPGGQGNDNNISDRDPSKPSLWQSEANRQKTIALWRKLAERYVNEQWIGGYDLLNEPNWGFEDTANDRNGLKEKTNAPLKALLLELTKEIRKIDTNHLIIIEGNGWGNNYNGMLPPWDNNMVLSFHKYWNRNDQQAIQHILNTRDQYNVPVWLGETGENSNVWFTQAIRLLEQHNIGWAWWPLKKLGFNNPLEIRSNPYYDRLLDYWTGRNPQPPSANDAHKGLMELAAATRCSQNIYHKDVIDAMFRQVQSSAARPFTPHLINGRTIIKAVHYDLGMNGVAYFDTDTADYHVSTGKRSQGNRGRVFRNDGVDIRRDSSTADGYYVSDMEKGEWLQYTVNVQSKKNYTAKLWIAADSTGGKIALVTGKGRAPVTIYVPVTGGNNNWQAVEIKNIPLQKGRQTVRIVAEAGNFSLKEIAFN
jgi:endoglucanase